jgi:hypothetical protein
MGGNPVFHVTCQKCGAWAIVAGGEQFHEALDATGTCICCPEDHNHRLATIESGQPCRPVHITTMAGAAPVTGA